LGGLFVSTPDYPGGSCRIIRPLVQQRLQIGRGYKYPSPSSLKLLELLKNKSQFEPPKSLDLHLQPFQAFDFWRIEGGDPDLHLHRRNFISLPICLETCALCFFGNPRCSCLYGVLASVAFLGASNSVVDVCPKLCVKVSVIAFKTTA
jgi:hypothetical protein